MHAIGHRQFAVVAQVAATANRLQHGHHKSAHQHPRATQLAQPRRQQAPAAHTIDQQPHLDTALCRLLRALDLPEAMRNTRVQFQSSGEEALAALLKTIDSAHDQLVLSTYVLAADTTGEQVAQALQRCVARGVRVRVLIDAIGSLQTPRTLLRDWRGMGIAVRRFMPLLHNPLYGRLNLRNHRKLVVADGRLLWSGGRNLADEYFVGKSGAAP